MSSRQCQYLRCDVDLTGSAGTFGMLMESNEDSDGIECHVKGAATANFLADGVGSFWLDCEDEGGSAAGFSFGQGGGLGAFKCGARGCTATSTIGYNMGITHAVVLSDCTAAGCATGRRPRRRRSGRSRAAGSTRAARRP